MATADEIFGELKAMDGTVEAGVAVAEPEPAPEPTPEPIAEPVAAPAVEPAPEPGERLRGPDGKFLPKTEATPDAPTDAAKDPQKVEGAPVVAPVAPAEPEVPVIPWQFRGSGMDITVPGALYKQGHGVFFPDKPETMDALRLLLTHGSKYDRVQERATRAEQQLQHGITRHQAENVAFKEVFGVLLDGEKLTEWMQYAAQNPAMAAKELALALREKHQDIVTKYAGQIVEAPKDGAPDEAAVQQVYESLDDAFESGISRVWPEIPAQVKQELADLVAANYQSFLHRAPADDPRGRWVRGQVVPAHFVLERFLRGEKFERQPSAPPPASAPRPAAPPVKAAPPTIGGPAKNLAGTQPGKPRPSDSSKEELSKFWGMPLG